MRGFFPHYFASRTIITRPLGRYIDRVIFDDPARADVLNETKIATGQKLSDKCFFFFYCLETVLKVNT